MPLCHVRRKQRLVLTRGVHCSDGTTVEPVAVAHVVVVRIEVEGPRADRAARVERTRPVAAVRANVVELVVPTVARSGQEETVAVRGGEEPTVHAILGRPSMGGVLVKFLPLSIGGHAPPIAPVGRGGIVARLEDGQIVGIAVVAIIGVVAVLGQLLIAVFVGAPVVGGLGLGLAPSKIITIFLRRVCSHIAGCP